jgi:hypothetical protein
MCIWNNRHLIPLYKDCLAVSRGLAVRMLRSSYVRACEAFGGSYIHRLLFVVFVWFDCDEKCDAVGLSSNCLLSVV